MTDSPPPGPAPDPGTPPPVPGPPGAPGYPAPPPGATGYPAPPPGATGYPAPPPGATSYPAPPPGAPPADPTLPLAPSFLPTGTPPPPPADGAGAPGGPSPTFLPSGTPPPPPRAGEVAAPEEYLPPPPGTQPTQLVGQGAAGHYGAEYDMTRVHRRNYDAPPGFAGFWRRFWGRVTTAMIVGIGYSIVLALIAGGTRFAYDNTQSCRTLSSGRDVCAAQDSVLWIGAALAFLLGVVVGHFTFVRRLSQRDGTFGMAQMGISVRMADRYVPITRREAQRRSIPTYAVIVCWSAVPAVVLLDLGRVATVVAIAVAAVAALAHLLAALPMNSDPRHQTPWDRFGDTVVVVDHEPSWYAVAAVTLGSILFYGTAIGALMAGTDTLREQYDRYSSGNMTFGKVDPELFVIAVVAVCTIALGHVGMRLTRWERKRPAGRGLALAGTLMGYAMPVTALVALLISFTTERVESLNDKTCRAARRDIVQAITSYRTLEGRLPVNLGQLADPIYLGEEVDDRDWTYILDGNKPGGYGLDGIGNCDRV